MRLRAPKFSLRTLNRCLTVVVAVFAVYIIAAPFLPEFQWWAQHSSPVQHIAPPPNVTPVAQGQQQPSIPGNVLVVPSINMEETIHEGANMWILSFGVWRLPWTSTPDKGGNTVLVGHRFTYTSPKGVFYYLDKINKGDLISVYWNSVRYQYIVTSISIVPPTDLSVEANTPAPELTLYTCTPLWTAQNRLIVVAQPVKGSA